MYQVKLYYGYETSETGVYHAFQALPPGAKVDSFEIGKELAEQLDRDIQDDNFYYGCMHIELPNELIAKIKEDAVREYLTKQQKTHHAHPSLEEQIQKASSTALSSGTSGNQKSMNVIHIG